MRDQTWIGADNPGFELPSINEAHEDLIGILHHVVVGEDVTVTRQDETGAERTTLALTPTIRLAAEEIAEELRQLLGFMPGGGLRPPGPRDRPSRC